MTEPTHVEYATLDAEAAYWHAAAQRAESAVEAVQALCSEHERGALRWADPLPVPPWISLVREAISAALAASVPVGDGTMAG